MSIGDEDSPRNPLVRMFRIKNRAMIALLVLIALSGYFRLWQISVALALLGIAIFVWIRGRNSRDQ